MFISKQEELSHSINAADSIWTLDGDEVNICLTKVITGETWMSVFKGHEALNMMQKEEMQKKMLLERFGNDVFS